MKINVETFILESIKGNVVFFLVKNLKSFKHNSWPRLKLTKLLSFFIKKCSFTWKMSNGCLTNSLLFSEQDFSTVQPHCSPWEKLGPPQGPRINWMTLKVKSEFLMIRSSQFWNFFYRSPNTRKLLWPVRFWAADREIWINVDFELPKWWPDKKLFEYHSNNDSV